jgi:hypothetical protein
LHHDGKPFHYFSSSTTHLHSSLAPESSSNKIDEERLEEEIVFKVFVTNIGKTKSGALEALFNMTHRLPRYYTGAFIAFNLCIKTRT